MQLVVTDLEKTYLLQLARHCIAEELGIDSITPTPIDSPLLQQSLGVFVTLHLRGNLRGCIGYVEGVEPLNSAIKNMAMAAAFHDYRFSPLSAREYPDLDIEISILSALLPIQGPEDIQIGRDGLLLRSSRHSGLLLPQVATEWHFSAEQFLEETARKAGLDRQAWQLDTVSLYRFEAVILQEITK